MLYDYSFYESTRIGSDQCDKSQQSIQNANSATYLLNNFKPSCPASNAFDFAVSNSLNFKDGHQVGSSGCNIDTNTKLSHSSLSRPKCRLSLMERPFLTVPYLGRGKRNVVMESQMQQGKTTLNLKSENQSSEICYMKYSDTPMIQPIKSTITNPANLVEGVADKTWVRGGAPTREIGKNYLKKNN